MASRSRNIEVTIGNILESYSAEVKEAAFKCAKQAAHETKRQLVSTSPRKTGAYARSWSIRKGKDSYTIHNRIPSLTHLLELGHKTKNQTGRYYRDTPAHPHIEKAEAFGQERYIELITEEVGSL